MLLPTKFRFYALAFFGNCTFTVYVLTNKYAYKHASYRPAIQIIGFFVAAGIYSAIDLFRRNKLRGMRGLVFSKDHKFHKGFGLLILNGALTAFIYTLVALGQNHTTATNTSVILASTVVPTALVGFLVYRTTLNRNQLLSMGVVLVGLYIAVVGFTALSLHSGDILILIATLTLGFTNSFAGRLMKIYDSRDVSEVRLLTGGSLALLSLVYFYGNDIFTTDILIYPVLAGAGTFLSVLIIMITVEKLGVNLGILLGQLHIMITPVAAMFVFDEKYRLSVLLGSLIMLGGIFLFTRSRKSPVVAE